MSCLVDLSCQVCVSRGRVCVYVLCYVCMYGYNRTAVLYVSYDVRRMLSGCRSARHYAVRVYARRCVRTAGMYVMYDVWCVCAQVTGCCEL